MNRAPRDRTTVRVKVLTYLSENGPTVERSALVALMPPEESIPAGSYRLARANPRSTKGNRRSYVLKRWLVNLRADGVVSFTPTHVEVLDMAKLRRILAEKEAELAQAS